MTIQTVDLLVRYLSSDVGLKHQRALLLGVPDCHFTVQRLLEFLKGKHNLVCDVKPEELQTPQSFKWATSSELRKYTCNVHHRTVFSCLGVADVSALDMSDYEGADLIHDLNTPVPSALEGAFDIIADFGTSEHVFSTKDVLFNITRMLKESGTVVHNTPVDFLNHGFVNFNACVYRDYYAINGFHELALKYIVCPRTSEGRDKFYYECEPEEFLEWQHPRFETSVFAVYRKGQNGGEPQCPQQGYYRGLWASQEQSRANMQRGIARRLAVTAVMSIPRVYYEFRRRRTMSKSVLHRL